MDILTELIKNDMIPALGVTEPGAIAFAVSKAKSYLDDDLTEIELSLNSGMYKNAFTCGIPNSDHLGNYYAAALGATIDSPNGLESLDNITIDNNLKAEKLIAENKVKINMSEISSRIRIEATVRSANDEVTVKIRDTHLGITEITKNGNVIFKKNMESVSNNNDDAVKTIHKFTLKELVDYVNNVPYSHVDFVLQAFYTNLDLLNESIGSNKTTYTKFLLEENGGKIIGDDEQKTASLLCNGAIEGRVLGLSKPAMSITGSGAHGIIATMPLYGVAKIRNLGDEKLVRATLLSYLICMYIKEYSGKLSAFCGCAIAAGTGMAAGLTYLYGGDTDKIGMTINNMASSITGMICDGGNHGCTMKGIVAVDAAFKSAKLAMSGVYINEKHGINGMSPEDTMHNMGLIASPGMVKTEETIVSIMENK